MWVVHRSLMTALLVAAGLAVGGGAELAPAATPSCAEGPQTVGDTIVGTPCDDTIRAPRSVTTVEGEGGNDTIYGGRGNDRLYGGPGDDRLRGGPGNDLLSGGFGADSLDGEAGDDRVRGDATIDAIDDTGGGIDTLSYATAATPGFFTKPGVYPDFSEYEGFPETVQGRGAYINLQTGKGDNGLAPDGGGVDEQVGGAGFEVVVGSAFPDYIVGTSGGETFYGGGGADVILGEGGDDVAYGGADGDSCDAASTLECESSGQEVELRDPGAIAAGLMAPQATGASPAVYLTGSDEDDEVTASYAAGAVTFELGPGSEGAFDTGGSAAGGCDPPAGGKLACPAAVPPDSVVVAGLAGDDNLSIDGFPETTSVILLGGGGADELDGGPYEDVLVDGPGDDVANAGAGDDAVPNNQGLDRIHAGAGEDLIVSDSVCEGDTLDGGGDRDNAQWAKFDSAVAIDMGARTAGLVGDDGQPDCGSDPLSSLLGIEDLEGSELADTLIGDSGPNQLLGRLGADTYHAAGGNDSILANSGDSDLSIDCGEGWDTAQVDHPQYGDPPSIDCESIHERDPNSFRPPDTPPDPNPPDESLPPPPSQPSPALDRTAPGVRILHRPPKHALSRGGRPRRVAFAFTANEPGARFLCSLDRRRFAPCRSPRVYWLRPGKHAVRISAVDAARNRDLTPARFAFRVQTLIVRSSRSHRRRAPTR